MKLICILSFIALTFTLCVVGEKITDQCVDFGHTCKAGFGKYYFTRPCCSGVCFNDKCRLGYGNATVPITDHRLPILQERCSRKLNSGVCDQEKVQALGPYCVCGCPKFVMSYIKYADACVPTINERISLIVACREYNKIENCPEYIKLYKDPECAAAKEIADRECALCGGSCSSI